MTPEQLLDFRLKLVRHLEIALEFTERTHDGRVGYIIERALDQARSDLWPTLDPKP